MRVPMRLVLVTLPIIALVAGCSDGGPAELDLEQMTVFGRPIHELTQETLEESLGPASDVRKAGGMIELCFYEKGLYFVRIPEGVQRVEGRIADVYYNMVTVYVASTWPGVQQSLYKPFTGRITKGLNSSWTRDRVMRTLRAAGGPPIDDQLTGDRSEPPLTGTRVELKFGDGVEEDSTRWPKNFWETLNIKTRSHHKIGVLDLVTDNGVGKVFYDVNSGVVTWVSIVVRNGVPRTAGRASPVDRP